MEQHEEFGPGPSRRSAKLLKNVTDLLAHASWCKEVLPTFECFKMRKHLNHFHDKKHEVNHIGSCQICNWLTALFEVHAKECIVPNCPASFCSVAKIMVEQNRARVMRMRGPSAGRAIPGSPAPVVSSARPSPSASEAIGPPVKNPRPNEE